MNFIIRICCPLLIFASLSCADRASINQTNNETKKDPAIEAKNENLERDKVITVTYESAAVYACATEYAFQTKEGKLILVRGRDNCQTTNIEIPDNMLEDSDNLEGPPGANPEMVGKMFNLYYKNNETPYKIESAK